jgi:hypothetical protein
VGATCIYFDGLLQCIGTGATCLNSKKGRGYVSVYTVVAKKKECTVPHADGMTESEKRYAHAPL